MIRHDFFPESKNNWLLSQSIPDYDLRAEQMKTLLEVKMSDARDKPAGAKWKWLWWLAIIALLIGAAKYFKLQILLKDALDWVGTLGAWGPVIFIIVYIAACVLMVPASLLTLSAGALFGVVKGSVLVSIGATLGATAAFLVGRYGARVWVAKRIENHATFQAIDEAVAREGWKIVLLTRLSPIFPFALLNYGFGVTSVPLRHYLPASWIGMMPAIVMYVYIGSLAKAAGEKSRTSAEWALYGVGLLATVIVSIFVTRIAKKALARKVAA